MQICYFLCFCAVIWPVYNWQYFTSLSDLMMSNNDRDNPAHVNSEYLFGECLGKAKKLYTKVHLDHFDVLGNLIVRGWLNITDNPTCVILKALCNEEQLFRSTTHPFQFCVHRITYCHNQRMFKYYLYEWYLPMDFSGGMNWDIYFYGTPN